MANKYEEGSYHIKYFDVYGTKLEEVRAEATSSTGAEKEAQAFVDEGGADSFVVSMVVINSKSRNDRWRAKNFIKVLT